MCGNSRSNSGLTEFHVGKYVRLFLHILQGYTLILWQNCWLFEGFQYQRCSTSAREEHLQQLLSCVSSSPFYMSVNKRWMDKAKTDSLPLVLLRIPLSDCSHLLEDGRRRHTIFYIQVVTYRNCTRKPHCIAKMVLVCKLEVSLCLANTILMDLT